MKILKNRLFIFVLGGIFFSSIAVFAVTTISADKITYTDKNNVERTVDTVLDDLYTTQNTTVNNLQTELVDYKKPLNINLCSESYANGKKSDSVLTLADYSRYKYFMIISTNSKNVNFQSYVYNDNTYTSKTDIINNQEYLTNNYFKYYLEVTATSESGWACAKFKFYN